MMEMRGGRTMKVSKKLMLGVEPEVELRERESKAAGLP
jgi:hypothetical protein